VTANSAQLAQGPDRLVASVSTRQVSAHFRLDGRDSIRLCSTADGRAARASSGRRGWSPAARGRGLQWVAFGAAAGWQAHAGGRTERVQFRPRPLIGRQYLQAVLAGRWARPRHSEVARPRREGLAVEAGGQLHRHGQDVRGQPLAALGQGLGMGGTHDAGRSDAASGHWRTADRARRIPNSSCHRGASAGR